MKYTYDYEKKGIKGQIKSFVLLSKSPRRRELLIFLNPEIMTVEIDERSIEEKYMSLYKDEDFITRVAKTCCEISKAKSDIQLEEGVMYISSDTMVIYKDKVYNKPKDNKEARQMFTSYFGHSHHVVTSVCLRMKDYIDVFYTVSRLDFVDYYEELKDSIDSYVESSSPLDKAGAYGIQELDPRFVKAISGDIHTIIGMPVAETSRRIFE